MNIHQTWKSDAELCLRSMKWAAGTRHYHCQAPADRSVSFLSSYSLWCGDLCPLPEAHQVLERFHKRRWRCVLATCKTTWQTKKPSRRPACFSFICAGLATPEGWKTRSKQSSSASSRKETGVCCPQKALQRSAEEMTGTVGM